VQASPDDVIQRQAEHRAGEHEIGEPGFCGGLNCQLRWPGDRQRF
jgi:hypothetical protein